MKIGIVSDIHENFHNLICCLQELEERKVEAILCLGDLMNAGIAKVLSIQSVPVFMIWGNNDGEKVDIMYAASSEGSNLKVSSFCYDFLEFDGKNIFITHYDNLAEPMAKSGLYDAIFYGHNHTKKIEKINDTWLVNPGEICAQKTGVSSYAIYDTTKNEVELFDLSEPVTYKTDLVQDYLSKNKERLKFRSANVFKL